MKTDVMPYYALMEVTKMSATELAALYDLVLFEMRNYIARHERCTSFVEHVDLWDAAALYHVLTSAGVFDDPLTFNRFSLIVERSLWQGSFSFDADTTLAEVETMLTKLGVMPFHASVLSGKSLPAHR